MKTAWGSAITRRRFLEVCAGSAAVLSAKGQAAAWAEPIRASSPLRPLFPDPVRGWRGDSSLAAWLRGGGAPVPQVPGGRSPAPPEPSDLAVHFSDLSRHFVFEYYPWYGGPPDYYHWDYLERHPPHDLSTPYVPRLGPYDVRSRTVLEQHARWIAEAGVGAIALSWWGLRSWEHDSVSYVLDVMKDHGIKATFALEPYADDRGLRYADDILFLLREFGEKRRWDTFLILKDADGSEGPVFKGFRCILPRFVEDCRGIVHEVSDHTPDDVWRKQIDGLRRTLREDFDHVTLLADSLEFRRTPDSGFDGIGIYDNFVPPESYADYAAGASRAGLLFSFNINPGYDQVEPRDVSPDDVCYAPRPFAPPTEGLDFALAEGRERAAQRSTERIRESFEATLAVQQEPALTNARRGFFLVYINSFNEWHEGHAFEPMQDAAALGPEYHTPPYHNPARGDYRLKALGAHLGSVLRRRPVDPAPPSLPPQAAWPRSGPNTAPRSGPNAPPRSGPNESVFL